MLLRSIVMSLAPVVVIDRASGWGKVARARWFQDLLAADELDR